MACILNIETATKVCSVAVFRENELLFKSEDFDGPSHASLLGVFVKNAVNYLKEQGYALDAVAVSCGPGSYTGLRIGVSQAKGLCYGLDIPLIAIETPLLLAQKVIQTSILPTEDVLLCPMIDARRMEVYSAVYDKDLNLVRNIQADIVTTDSYREYLDKAKVLFFGDGSAKCKEVLSHENAIFLENIYPTAEYMNVLANNFFEAKEFVDVAYFEPLYLKDFITTTSKKKLF